MKEKIPFLVLIIFFISIQIAQAGDDWVQKSPSSKPTARENHALTYIGDDKVILYGGWTGSKNGETWIYDLSDNTWTQQSPTNSPGIRTDHAMAYLGGDKVLMFGGSDENYSFTSSCWIYDLSDNTWTDAEPLTRPDSRRYHAMAYIGDGKVLLVGGESGSGYTGETWIYDLTENTWTEKSNLGYGIFKHSVCFIGGDQVLLAGIRTSDGVVDDSYIFDLSDNSWTQKADMPSARAHGDMVYIGDNKAMFFGGYDNGYWYTNTTYIFSSTGNSWSTDANSTSPSARINHRLAETSFDGSSFIVLFGGGGDARNDETWTFGGSDYPLPVELISFSAKAVNGEVVLEWQTATEVDNYGFDIQRALTELSGQCLDEWIKVGFVPGNGNCNSIRKYSFTDKSINSGKYFYRLRQIDTDGSFDYSPIINVEIEIPNEFALSQNYPNPFNPITTINYQIPKRGKVMLKIYDIVGKEITTIVNEEKEIGNYSINFDSNNLSSGVYLYEIVVNNYHAIKKLVIIK